MLKNQKSDMPRVGGFPLTPADTSSSGVTTNPDQALMPTLEEAKVELGEPSPIEQFCYDMGLTTTEADMVEIICSHKSASELHMLAAKARKLEALAYGG